MKKLMAAILAFSFIQLPMPVLAESVRLTEGTLVELKLVDTLSSKDATEGQTVNLEVANDIFSDDGKQVLIKAGTAARGNVSNVEERGRMGKEGELSLNVDSTKAVDGSRVPLRAMLNKEGKDKTGSVIALSLIISPLFLLKRGKDAKIPAGSRIKAYVDREMMVALPEAETKSAFETPVSTDIQASLEALVKLRDQGLLSNEEFEAKRQQLVK